MSKSPRKQALIGELHDTSEKPKNYWRAIPSSDLEDWEDPTRKENRLMITGRITLVVCSGCIGFKPTRGLWSPTTKVGSLIPLACRYLLPQINPKCGIH